MTEGNITQTAGRDLDVLVAERVLGWERHRDGIFGQPRFITEFAGRENMPQPEDCPEFSTDIAAAWLLVERMAELIEENNGLEYFQGPQYKSSRTYLTQEGYPLGTTCWYVFIEVRGLREFVCADTPALAVCQATLRIKEELMP